MKCLLHVFYVHVDKISSNWGYYTFIVVEIKLIDVYGIEHNLNLVVPSTLALDASYLLGYLDM